MKDTLCFSCQNAVPNKEKCLGCPWSESFEPVEGWNAMPTTLSESDGIIDSYLVLECPMYIPDEV